MNLERRFRTGECLTCFHAYEGKNYEGEDTYFCMRFPPIYSKNGKGVPPYAENGEGVSPVVSKDVFPEVSGDYRCGEYLPGDEVMLMQILERITQRTAACMFTILVDHAMTKSTGHQEVIAKEMEKGARLLRKAIDAND